MLSLCVYVNMSLVLHKIVAAIRVEENVISGISKIERYSLAATSSILTTREITNVDGVIRMNGKATQQLSHDLSMGFTSALKDIYKIDNIPKSLELRSLEDIKALPSYEVGQNIRYVDQKLKPELSSKLDSKTLKLMESTNLNDKITPSVVERNPVLKNIFNKMSGKTMKTVGGTLLTIGVGTGAICTVVNEHRNRLTACMLYYYDNNQLRRCAIATCTCKAVACTKNCNYCKPSILKKYLPDDMLHDNCGDFKGSSAGCVKCPSDNYNKANIFDDSTLHETSVSDSSFVRCQKPDFFEALSDLFGGASEDLLDIIRGSLNGISSLVKYLPYIIIAAIIGTLIIIIISIFGKFTANRKQHTGDYNEINKTVNI